MASSQTLTSLLCFGLFAVSLGASTSSNDTCSLPEIETCPGGEPIIPPDWANPGVFDDLTVTEIKAATDYMIDSSGLPLVRLHEASLKNAFIHLVELHPSRKIDVLRYLDEQGPKPVREARVIVLRGDLPAAEARIEEYKVGPLPKPTYHAEIRNSKWKYPIPFSARPYNWPQVFEQAKFVTEKLQAINHILKESCGYEVKPGEECNDPHSNCITMNPSMPGHIKSGHHSGWYFGFRTLEGGFLYPVGLEVRVKQDSADKDDWVIDMVWYQGEYYDSIQAMLDAYENGELKPKKVEEPEGAYTRDLPSSMNFRGDPLPQKPQAGTKSYYPDGRRFKVDQHHVAWQGWDFDFTLRMSQGILVHDIKYRGERIAYEISLQEVSVLYGGAAPSPMHAIYFDSVSQTGSLASQLFRGIDCPDGAAFFDFPFYLFGFPVMLTDRVCVFEHDRGVPLRRHYDTTVVGYKWAQGMRDIVLVTRAIFSVYNYDYIIDIMLHQDGEIEVKSSLTGYTLNSYFTGPEDDRHGHQTTKDSLANVHNHMIHFKADLDIGGQNNRFHVLNISIEEQDDPTYPGEKIYNRVVHRNLANTEKEAAIQFDFNSPSYLVQYDENSRNYLGYQRGYRIAPASMTKMVLPDSYRGARARAWMKYQVAVTKYDDEELRSSNQYATNEPFDPVMSFDDFIDNNENIVDEDLVSWVTLGVHHIPHSEDVPVVLTPPVQLTFFLLPYNYFDQDPSLASRDNIRVTPSEDGDVFEYAGVSGTFCCQPQTSFTPKHHSLPSMLILPLVTLFVCV